MRKFLAVAIAGLVTGWCQFATGQNVIQDYICKYPRQFAPDTPFVVGKVLKTQIGHGGLFYNCDCQEEKRYSPYIYWQCQTPRSPKHCPVVSDVKQQWHEVKQRIRWGKGCDVPYYVVPQYPLQFYGTVAANTDNDADLWVSDEPAGAPTDSETPDSADPAAATAASGDYLTGNRTGILQPAGMNRPAADSAAQETEKVADTSTDQDQPKRLLRFLR